MEKEDKPLEDDLGGSPNFWMERGQHSKLFKIEGPHNALYSDLKHLSDRISNLSPQCLVSHRLSSKWRLEPNSNTGEKSKPGRNPLS